MRPKAIALVGLGPKQLAVLAGLRETNFTLLGTEEQVEHPFRPEQFICLRTAQNAGDLRQRAEVQARREFPAVWAEIQRGLAALSESLCCDLREFDQMTSPLQASLFEMLFYGAMLESALVAFDVKAVVTNLSFIDKQQGAIAVAHAHDIPTLHLQHGVWISQQSSRPENVDVTALADWFSLEIFQHQQQTATEGCVTGLPICLPVNEKAADINFTREQQAQARTALGLQAQALTVLYSATWSEGIYLATACHGHLFVKSLEQLFAALKQIETSGVPTQVILRQHPSIVASEDSAAFLDLAWSLGYSSLKVINEDKELCMQAADAMLTPRNHTSVLLDAFAEGRPVISQNIIPDAPDHIGDQLISSLIDVAADVPALSAVMLKLYRDPVYWEQRVKQGLSFIRSVRSGDQSSACKNLVNLILELTQLSREQLPGLSKRWNERMLREQSVT